MTHSSLLKLYLKGLKCSSLSLCMSVLNEALAFELHFEVLAPLHVALPVHVCVASVIVVGVKNEHHVTF